MPSVLGNDFECEAQASFVVESGGEIQIKVLDEDLPMLTAWRYVVDGVAGHPVLSGGHDRLIPPRQQIEGRVVDRAPSVITTKHFHRSRVSWIGHGWFNGIARTDFDHLWFNGCGRFSSRCGYLLDIRARAGRRIVVDNYDPLTAACVVPVAKTERQIDHGKTIREARGVPISKIDAAESVNVVRVGVRPR